MCLVWPFWTQLCQWKYSHSCSFRLAWHCHSSSEPKCTGIYISYLLRGGGATCVVCRDNSIPSSCCNGLLKCSHEKEQEKMFGMERTTQKAFPGHLSNMGSIGNQDIKALHTPSVMESAGLGWDGACNLHWWTTAPQISQQEEDRTADTVLSLSCLFGYSYISVETAELPPAVLAPHKPGSLSQWWCQRLFWSQCNSAWVRAPAVPGRDLT